MLTYFFTSDKVSKGFWGTLNMAEKDAFSRMCSIPFLQENSWDTSNFLLQLTLNLSWFFLVYLLGFFLG